MYTRKITASLLLALFAFILVEKSTHGHSKTSLQENDRHSIIKSSYNCLICDFQLSADADLPEHPTPQVFSSYIPPFKVFITQDPLTQDVFHHPERGPPSSVAVL